MCIMIHKKTIIMLMTYTIIIHFHPLSGMQTIKKFIRKRKQATLNKRLLRACEQDSYTQAKKLLENGAIADKRHANANSLLLIRLFKRKLLSKHNVFIKTPPLACKKNFWDILYRSYCSKPKQNHNIYSWYNSCDHNEYSHEDVLSKSPLIQALKQEKIKRAYTIARLLHYRKRIITNSNRRIILHVDYDIKTLIPFKKKINHRDIETNNTALIELCEHKKSYTKYNLTRELKIAKWLIQSGINIHAKNYQGYTALFSACKEKRLDLIKILLKAGVKTEIPNKKGETPLLWICKKLWKDKSFKKTAIALYLIKNGAKINTIDREENTPLIYTCRALRKNNHTILQRKQLIYTLIDRGANINATNKNGTSPLYYILNSSIANEYRLELLLNFIKIGADINLQRYLNICNTLETAKILIKNGAKVNYINKIPLNTLSAIIARIRNQFAIKRTQKIMSSSTADSLDYLVDFITDEPVLMYAKQIALARLIDYSLAHPYGLNHQLLKDLFNNILFNVTLFEEEKFQHMLQFALTYNTKDKNGIDIIEAFMRYSKQRYIISSYIEYSLEIENMLQQRLEYSSTRTFTDDFRRYINVTRELKNKELFKKLFNLSIVYRNFTDPKHGLLCGQISHIPRELVIHIFKFLGFNNFEQCLTY